MNKLSAEELREQIIDALNENGWASVNEAEWVTTFLEDRGWTLDDIKKHNEEEL